jgi:hypothetical protein
MTPAVVVATPTAKAVSGVQNIGTAVNRFLTGAANWLAQLPANPITDLLQGALYLVRRTFFPASVGVVTAPIVVPIYPTKLYDGPNEKLGIYIGFGSDAKPALFELDTGGAGIYGAYASNEPTRSGWWGDGVVVTPESVTVKYDSGNEYQGFAATAQVSFFADGGTTPLLSTARVIVGQMDSIQNGGKTLWTPDGLPPDVSTPPIDQAFYGDFGLAQQYSPKAISNVLAQLVYTNGVLPGYRLHVDTEAKTAWLQIGLTNADLQDPSVAYFPEVLDPSAPSSARNPYSHLRYYSPQVFQANIKISTTGPEPTTILDSADVGMTADTGASTTLHNTDMTPLPLPYLYAGITEKGKLREGLNFNVSGTTTTGAQAQVFNFTTVSPDPNKPNFAVVEVQNNKPNNTTYYLNTGLLLFYQNDVIYYLGNRNGGGLIGLSPRTGQ